MNKSKIGLLFSLILVMIIGAVYVRYTWITSMNEISEQAMEMARVAEYALNGEMINKLNALPEDLGTAPYESIKKRLMSIKSVRDDIRFVYIYTRKNGILYFMADSEPADSKDYSSPGQMYSEANDQYKKPFENKEAIITSPAADRWGTWVSVLIPMKNDDTGDIKAVFAVDYPAENWNNEAIKNTVQSGVIFLFSFLLVISFYRIMYKNIMLKKEKKISDGSLEALRVSREKYHSIVTAASDAIWMTDLEGNFTYVNPAMTRLTKYERDELLGKNIFSFIESSERKHVIQAHIDQLKNNSEELYTEVCIISKTGEKLWLGHHVQLIWKNSKVEGFQAIGRDITAIKNKDREMEIARLVNDAIMRKTADSDNIATLYYPMREIGGDIIDILKFTDPDKIGIIIGDVSGHGVPAALIAAMLKGVISKAGDVSSDPSAFLSYLNESMFGYNGGYFITAFYAIFTVSTGQLVFSNAGHNPVILIGPDKVSFIDSTKGVPLGIMSSEDLLDFKKMYSQLVLTVHPGEKVLFYTDGLSEAGANDDSRTMFEDNALMESLYKNRMLKGRDFIDAVFADLVLFHGNDSFDDDISMLLLEHN